VREYSLGPPGVEVAEPELRRAVEVLSARLEALRPEFKLASCSVQAVPPRRLRVQFRSSGDPLAPLAWLAMQGKAEFRLLHPRDDILLEAGAGALPAQYEVKVYREKRTILTKLGRVKTVEHQYAVERKPVLTVSGFKAVEFAAVGARKNIVLTFRFDEPDAAAFGALTALHAGRRMAMLIDGAMFFPPKRIESAVTAGGAQVQGFFHIADVRRLAKVLDCGSLPAPLEEVARGTDEAGRPPAASHTG
jgi:preprotein translocase subunit SecD